MIIKKQRENKIRQLCPNITSNPGIYVFYRYDESGLKMCYCGQAIKLLERCAQHLGEYDHIALSLKKRGLYSDTNPYGWQLEYTEYPKEELDDKERETILEYANNGWQLYNRTTGGQDSSKRVIGEGKSTKGYYDGIQQGRKSLAKELRNIIEKHLEVKIKPGKEKNKVSQKQFDKFNDLINQ